MAVEKGQWIWLCIGRLVHSDRCLEQKDMK